MRATGARRSWSLLSGGRGSSTTASGSPKTVPMKAIVLPSGDQSGLPAPSASEVTWRASPELAMSSTNTWSTGPRRLMKANWRPAAFRGFIWGVLAGLALVALMYLAGSFLGLRPLPQALSGPLLAIMPGFVFGFLIDTLQHAGKVVEEFGLIVAMVAGLGVLGAAWAVTSRRWQFGQSALVFAAVGWLVVVGV